MARRSLRNIASSSADRTAAGASRGSALIALASCSESFACASRAALTVLPTGLRSFQTKRPPLSFASASAIWRPENFPISP